MTDTTIARPASETGGPPTFGLFIAGEWCESTSRATFESRNPADTRDVIGRFQQGTAADVAMAIRAAETAFPLWRRTPAPKRGEILYRFGALMAEHKELLSQAMSREMGKVIAEARGRRPGRHRHRLPHGRRGPPDVRGHGPERAARQVGDERPRANRRGRDHHALELPDRDSLLEDDACARDRQHRRVQAVERHAALRDPRRRAHGGSRLPGRNREPRHGGGRRRRRRDRRLAGHRGHFVHGFFGDGKRIAAAAARRLKRVSLELGGKNGDRGPRRCRPRPGD